MYPKRYLTRRSKSPIEPEIVPTDRTLIRSILSLPNCLVRLKEDGRNILAVGDIYFHLGVMQVLLGVKFTPLKHKCSRLPNWWFDLKELEEKLAKLYQIVDDYLKGSEFDTIGAIESSKNIQVTLHQLCKDMDLTVPEMMKLCAVHDLSIKSLKVVKTTKPSYSKPGRPTREEMLKKLAIPLGEELPKANYPKKRKNRFLTKAGKPYGRKFIRLRKKKAVQRRKEKEAKEKEQQRLQEIVV